MVRQFYHASFYCYMLTADEVSCSAVLVAKRVTIEHALAFVHARGYALNAIVWNAYLFGASKRDHWIVCPLVSGY